MTQISAGLAMFTPQRFPELVYPPSFPFRKDFLVFNAIWFSTLEFEVLTSYDSWTSVFADVRINGVSVGQIPPRGYTQTAGQLAPVSFQFGNGMLETMGALGRTGFNRCEIVPASYDYLIVANWRLHYFQLLP